MIRRVALELLEPGLGTKQVPPRFEAKRQALAVMEHGNSATVVDAGATESGRPYFVTNSPANEAHHFGYTVNADEISPVA